MIMIIVMLLLLLMMIFLWVQARHPFVASRPETATAASLYSSDDRTRDKDEEKKDSGRQRKRERERKTNGHTDTPPNRRTLRYLCSACSIFTDVFVWIIWHLTRCTEINLDSENLIRRCSTFVFLLISQLAWHKACLSLRPFPYLSAFPFDRLLTGW